LIGASAGCVSVKGEDVPKKLNVVIFLADDLGYGDLGCYSNPILRLQTLTGFLLKVFFLPIVIPEAQYVPRHVQLY
jgi:hypothetical protein